MTRVCKRAGSALGFLCLSVAISACHSSAGNQPRAALTSLPPIVLWAWERPEDLEFLDPQKFGVAFLAQTLVLNGDEVIFRPRRQPLKVRPETKLIAVTRVESITNNRERPALSASQRERLVSLTADTLKLSNVSVIQIDFDAAQSEREFYRLFLNELRQKLPANVPLSMTALASFCVGDRWLEGLPVDEAVPMIFRMGLDDRGIKSFLASGNDFNEPLCRTSYGIALDEPFAMVFEKSRRLYVFKSSPWTKDDLSAFQELKR